MKGKTQIHTEWRFLNDHSEPLGEVFLMPSVAFVLVHRFRLTARNQTALNDCYL